AGCVAGRLRHARSGLQMKRRASMLPAARLVRSPDGADRVLPLLVDPDRDRIAAATHGGQAARHECIQEVSGSIALTLNRLDEVSADDQRCIIAAREPLNPAGDVDDVSDHRGLAPALVTDVAGGHRSIMDTDPDPDGRSTASGSLSVPPLHFLQDSVGAEKR